MDEMPMEGTEAVNSQPSEPVPVEVSTSSVIEDSANGTHRVSFDKDIRGNSAYRLVSKDKVRVTLMSDGEIRIKKLADTVP